MHNRPYRILIIDSNPEDREIHRDQISRNSKQEYEFWETGNASQGLQLCRDREFDCILLDYLLPDMDGLEFLVQFQTEFSQSETPVVMLTGHGNEMIAVQAMKMGVHDYLTKGVGSENLAPIIQSAIDKTEVRRQVAERDRVMQALSQERLELIAKLQQQTAALTETDRRKDEFLAMLAHELRNPLAPLRNGLQLLRLKPDDATIRDSVCPIMERQVQHLSRLVDDLLDVSRISHGKIELERESVDLDTVLRRATEACQSLIDTRQHALNVSFPVRTIRFDADPIRLEQIVTNLLNNAAKYTPEGGEIRLSGEAEGDDVVIRVCDNGIGISEEMLPTVFDMFTQADNSLAKSQGGLGIGLTLVQLLVKLHGGTVEGRSAGLGQGTEFVVRLPLKQTVPTRLEQTAPQAKIPVCALKVLVVDDNVDAAQTLATLIKVSGHDVSVTFDGETALSMIEFLKPHLVFLDIGMPGLTGYEVAEQVRAKGGSSPILVAITGYGQEDDLRRSRAAGFNYHFVKPIEIDRLMELLSATMAVQ